MEVYFEMKQDLDYYALTANICGRSFSLKVKYYDQIIDECVKCVKEINDAGNVHRINGIIIIWRGRVIYRIHSRPGKFDF